MQYLLRNKIIFFLAIIFAMPSIGVAQNGFTEINIPEHDNQKVRFGITVGGNRSHYNILHSPRFLEFDSINVIESINSTGISLAGLVNLRLNEHLDLRGYPLNLIFTEKAFEYRLKKPDLGLKEDSITVKKVQGISLAFPVQLKFTSDRIQNFKAYMLAGARVEYDLAANAGKKNNTESITLKKLDYAAEAAIGFHFYFPVFVLTPEIKISYGLKNVLSRETNYKYANTIDDIRSRSITFTLTVE
jgi:Outer membrane protein beta-barrel domain